MTELTPELEAIKAKQKATWGAGDYGVVAKNLEASALEFLARIPIEPGTRVLDVACGTGQMAFPAAAAGARVTGIDIAPGLIEQARARAESEGAKIRFDEGDAEALPYEDGSFDLVISLIGAMFAPRPELVASELMRVCRPGGRIVMGNWTPEGFIGSFFKAVGKHLPPPSGIRSPLEWGNALRRGGILPHLFRTDEQGVRRPRSRRPGGSAERSGEVVDDEQPVLEVVAVRQ
jgi:SAM-dependent methyltransferase